MRAARRFLRELKDEQLLSVRSIRVELYGSLVLTGKGHGTDRAILLGLSGEEPDHVDPATAAAVVSKIQEQGAIQLLGMHAVRFDPRTDLLFHSGDTLPRHSNGMRFTVSCPDGLELDSRIFYSIGGGFIITEDEQGDDGVPPAVIVPYRFRSAADLLRLGKEHEKAIWTMVLENEKVSRSQEEVHREVFRRWKVMQDCTDRGLRTEGILEGGLNVRRRAPHLHESLCNKSVSDPLAVVDWINLFAIAVNEENAAGGRVVTAPTSIIYALISTYAICWKPG